MTLQTWFDIYGGQGVDYDGWYGYQCVDLIDQYLVDVIGASVPWVEGAKDFWNLELDWCYKIGNDPSNCPQRGDIVVWGTAVGGYGHIAICVTGDVNSFVSLDQNWPYGLPYNLNPSQVCSHNYNGVLGWFRPNLALDYPGGWSSEDYLNANPDVRAAGVDPVWHWMHYGFRENRVLHPAPPAPTPPPVVVEIPIQEEPVIIKDEPKPEPIVDPVVDIPPVIPPEIPYDEPNSNKLVELLNKIIGFFKNLFRRK